MPNFEATAFAVGSASGSGRALRIDLPSLAYVLPSGTTSLAQADLLAVTPDADVLAVSLPGKIVFYDTATMAETGSYTLGSGVVVGDLGWR